MINKMTWLIAVSLVALVGLGGCNNDSGGGGDSDGDSDGDGDSDTDTGEWVCEPTAAWGSGFTVGAAVANWSLTGIFDADGDGTVEDTEAPFTLEDMYCAGKRSVVIMVSDMDCSPCGQWYGSLSNTSFYQDILDANGTALMFYSAGLGASTQTATQAHEYFSSDYGFEPGYYAGGPPSVFTFGFFPYMAVIDLNTGILVDKDSDGHYLEAAAIINMVQTANQ